MQKLGRMLGIGIFMRCKTSKSPHIFFVWYFGVWSLDVWRNVWLIFAATLCGPKNQRLLRKRRVSQFVKAEIFGELEVLNKAQF